MAYPFNHKEFVAMMEQYNLKSNSITIPEHTILNDLVTENRDCVYLLKSGILAGYIDFDQKSKYKLTVTCIEELTKTARNTNIEN